MNKQKAEKKPIAINSRLGSLAFKMQVLPKPDAMEKLAEQALQKVLFHDCGSKLFAEKSGFKRDSAFSPELQARGAEVFQEKLGSMFEIVEIEFSGYEKESDESKFLKFCKSLGLDAEKARAGWEAAKGQEEKPAQVIE